MAAIGVDAVVIEETTAGGSKSAVSWAAIFAGAAYSLGIIIPQLVQRRYSPHSVIPYGPFLVLGALVIYFFGADFAAYWLKTH